MAQLPCPPATSFIRGHADLLGPPQGYLYLANALKQHGKTFTMRIYHKLVCLHPNPSGERRARPIRNCADVVTRHLSSKD